MLRIATGGRLTVQMFTMHGGKSSAELSHTSHLKWYTTHCWFTIGGSLSFGLTTAPIFRLVYTGWIYFPILRLGSLSCLRTELADLWYLNGNIILTGAFLLSNFLKDPTSPKTFAVTKSLIVDWDWVMQNRLIGKDIHPVYTSRKIGAVIKPKESKPPIVNQACAVHHFKCDLCDADYVGCTCRHLYQRIDERKGSVIGKHVRDQHGGGRKRRISQIQDLTEVPEQV